MDLSLDQSTYNTLVWYFHITVVVSATCSALCFNLGPEIIEGSVKFKDVTYL